MYQGHEDRPLAGIDGGCDFDGTRVTVITGGGSSQSGRHGMYLKPALNTGRITFVCFQTQIPSSESRKRDPKEHSLLKLASKLTGFIYCDHYYFSLKQIEIRRTDS
jgi:hypothetical protein